ncbi:GNAT family N-acetyltransferase [Lapidilactobacillus wuchangensis]|uniref:GNAT family N-acetyltransferase n=1 Tax=Lapidilactobacillus wuchangensis TaxID=2486001 RepID=UPI000F78B4F1|nr:GNAT family N-acetyltransferase [Lapidilactobacillus wuchangensis]
MSEDVAVTIRSAEASDAAALLAFWQTEVVPCDFVETDAALTDLTAAQLAPQLTAIAASPNNLLLLAVADAEIIGYLRIAASANPATAHVGELGLLVATADRQIGLGSALMDMALTWVAEQSILKRVQLFVQTRNLAAQKLYQKFDFTLEGRLPASYRSLNGDLLETLLMARLF